MRPLARLCLVVSTAILTTACGGGSVFRLDAGDCFQDPEGQEEEITDVEVVDCDEAHDNEAFHTFDLSGDEYPEEDELIAVIDEECFGEAFEDYVGEPYETSELEVFPITPTQGSWDDADDREVACAVFIPGEQLEGSVQSSGR